MLSLMPDYADPARLCALGKVYEGEVALADLPRLSPLLASSEGTAAFTLTFATDAEKRPVVTVSVRGALPLICQRCMRPMWLDVDTTSHLGVVTGPIEAERLPDDLDPLLVENPRLALRELIEDELILAIPPAPMHDMSECAVQLNAFSDAAPEPGDESPVADNPFAVLAELKSDPDNQD